MPTPERPTTPLWWYALVGVAIILAVLLLISAVVGFLLGLLKLAIVVILAIAAVSWVVGRKVER